MSVVANSEVIKAAAAQSRQGPAGPTVADEGALSNVGGPSLDKAGIKDTGYIDKKGTAFGVQAMFNKLPPGSDIDNQETADIRELPLKNYGGGLGYPGDGWT